MMNWQIGLKFVSRASAMRKNRVDFDSHDDALFQIRGVTR